ncbi:MAG: hypothetical protein HWE07_11640 [Cytophagia bacterium]|nr:hypothetical protein [Cytophagia bacterium]
MKEFELYRHNLVKSSNLNSGLLVSPMDNSPPNVLKRWVKGLCESTGRVGIGNYDSNWLSLESGMSADIPSWAEYLTSLLSKRKDDPYLTLTEILSDEFSAYWKSTEILVKNDNDKVVGELSFGFFAQTLSVKAISYDLINTNTPFIAPLKGALLGKRNNSSALKFLKNRKDAGSINVVFGPESYCVDGDYSNLLAFISNLYSDSCLTQNFEDVCIESLK